jgi:hypothetical protein
MMALKTEKTIRAEIEIMARYADCKCTKAFAAELGIDRRRLYVLAHRLGVVKRVQKESQIINENLMYIDAKEPEPTEMRPGTPGKLAVLMARIRDGKKLFSGGDFQTQYGKESR